MSAGQTIDLADLRARGIAAVGRLTKMASRHQGEAQVRLKGKVEGVNLVLSYLDEAIRIARYAPSSQDDGPTISPMSNHDELIERYRHHPPTGEAVELHEQIRAKHLELALWLEENLPDCREKSLAQTALQQSSMWSNGAVAIHVSGKQE